MTFLPRLLAFGAAVLMAASVQAADIKIAMNGVDDAKTNAEAAFAGAFVKSLAAAGITAQVFASDTLGNEKERFDQVAQGLLEVDLATASTTYGMSPLVKGVQLPFFFKDGAQFDEIVNKSGILKAMNKPLLPNGIRLVGFDYIGVGIGIHNTKHPIATLDDLKGLRFRALNAEQLDFEQALGAHGTVIAWAEVANALQTGVADGYLNPPNSAIRTGQTRFLKYFTPANISPSTRVVLISEDWYSALDGKTRSAVDAALAAGLAANRAWVVNWSKEVRAKQKELGVTVTELAPGARAQMAERAKTVWPQMLKPAQMQQWLDARKSVTGE